MDDEQLKFLWILTISDAHRENLPTSLLIAKSEVLVLGQQRSRNCNLVMNMNIQLGFKSQQWSTKGNALKLNSH